MSGGASDKAARLLFVGDVHLGRRPGGLPSDLDEHGLTAAELTPAAAWRNVVEYALREKVDAVVLAGDVVESENARFEAFGPLDREVRRLVQAGIDVIAVTGNHDVEALPRLARLLPEFRLLGAAGRWELLTVKRGDLPVAHLLGWSFPEDLVETSPLADTELPTLPEDGLPRIGVLHCDLDAAGSRYAPVTRTELDRAGVDGWLLGHIHVPSDLAGGRPVGYLGSLVGLDPTETGQHGPWLVRVDADGALNAKQLPLAPLRWASEEVAVGELLEPEQLHSAFHRAFETIHDSVTAQPNNKTLAVGCRFTLTGTPAIHRALADRLRTADLATYSCALDDVVYFVNKIVDRSRPRLNLEEIAGADTPPGLLARRLLQLQGDGDSAAELVRKTRARLVADSDDPRWSYLDRPVLDDAQVRELLVDAGMRALEDLLEQDAG